MIVRTQIALDSEDHRRAKRRAGELGISFAEYVRRAIARDLGGGAAPADAGRLLDIIDSGGSDVAAHRDEYVAAAVAEEHRRETGRAPGGDRPGG